MFTCCCECADGSAFDAASCEEESHEMLSMRGGMKCTVNPFPVRLRTRKVVQSVISIRGIPTINRGTSNAHRVRLIAATRRIRV